MPAKPAPAPFDVVERLLAAYATNNRINEYLIKNVPAEAWAASPPGGKGRSIPGIVGHIHNVRLMWLKAVGAATVPAKLEGNEFSKDEAIELLRLSTEAMMRVVEPSLRSDGRIKGFKPDVTSFLGYLFAHDAHHRGQISMLARQLGHPLPQSAMFGMWEWGTR
jgi:uncharacterized damage-inducible protein DinB